MRESRLTHAIATGAVHLPDAGRIAVFAPRANADLSALPRERVQVIQGFRPDHDAWAGRGYGCDVAPRGRYGASVVFVPRARDAARALIATALEVTDGPVAVDGQKTDGIDSLLKACQARGRVSAPVIRDHGKLFALDAAPEAFADWQVAPAAGPEGWITVPGVFSAGRVDAGSALLVAALPGKLKGRVADLGAGWGYLSAQALGHEGITEMHLIEAEHAALDCARANVTDPRARFHWADATTFTPEAQFDVILANPPFHEGRAADPGLGQAFVGAAARMLTPSGQLWLVANRQLPYERTLAAQFREVAEVAGNAGFKVLRAARPVPRRGR